MTAEAAVPPDGAPLALTMGDPAGIGGEITLQAWRARAAQHHPYFALDDPDRLQTLARALGIACPIVAIGAPDEARAAFAEGLPVLPLSRPVSAAPGQPDRAAAEAAIESLDRAVTFALDGRASAIVTNPVHKATLYQAGFDYPGHTEYLAARAASGAPPVMMLACPVLRVVPVTVHMALREAVRSLTQDAILHAGHVTAEALRRDFGIARPRLAIAGLNPHAGEQGHMGGEEIELITPAIDALKARGIDASGPFPADTMFHAGARESYDAALCMYHDQALIPLKTLDFSRGVNITLGLEIVRTSPDHGTAFDIAGTGRADPASLIAALALAGEIAQRRRMVA